jgi:two-component system response regulator YesN
MPGVLIADATPITRTAIAQIVARERPWLGPLVEVGAGDQAVEVARSMRPDVVLMDVNMPGLDGLAAGAQIRAEHPAVKLVLLAAHSEFAHARQALRIGAADYLLKPVGPAELVTTLDQLQLPGGWPGRPMPLAPSMSDGPAGARPAQPGADRGSALARALAHMQYNLHRSDLRLSEVAEVARMSSSHLAALMRRQLGRSYLGYLTHLRIERAKQLLRSTDLTVAAVAEAVGYETPAPFYHRFKQAVGQTPLGFRNQPCG